MPTSLPITSCRIAEIGSAAGWRSRRCRMTSIDRSDENGRSKASSHIGGAATGNFDRPAHLSQVECHRDWKSPQLFDNASYCGGGQVMHAAEFRLGHDILRRKKQNSGHQHAPDTHVVQLTPYGTVQGCCFSWLEIGQASGRERGCKEVS